MSIVPACYFRSRQAACAGHCLQRGFRRLEVVALSQFHEIVLDIMVLLDRLRHNQFVEIGNLLVRHLANLAGYGKERNVGPSSEVFHVLTDSELNVGEDLIATIRSYLRTLYVARLGEDHVAVIELDLARERDHVWDMDANQNFSDIQSSIAAFDRKFGHLSRRALINMAAICHRLGSGGHPAAAGRIVRQMLARMRKSDLRYRQKVGIGLIGGRGTLDVIQAALCVPAGIRCLNLFYTSDPLYDWDAARRRSEILSFERLRSSWCVLMQSQDLDWAKVLQHQMLETIQSIDSEGERFWLECLMVKDAIGTMCRINCMRQRKR